MRVWWGRGRETGGGGRRGFLLIDGLTCGLQMTGRASCHEECLCYFPSRGGNEFLVILFLFYFSFFVAETLPAGARVVAARLETEIDGGAGVS